MSATASSASVERDQSDQSSTFEDAVWDDPCVCNNCFRRCKESHELPETAPDVATDEQYRTDDGTIAYAHDEYNDAGTAYVARPRTTCAECGSIRLLVTYETLSTRDALNRVPKLLARLREAGHQTSKNAVYRTVRELKSCEGTEAYDKEIFERATKLGVEYAGRLP